MSLISLAQHVLDLDVGSQRAAAQSQRPSAPHRSPSKPSTKAAAAAVPSSSHTASRQRALPRQQRKAMSPQPVAAQEYSADLSLRSQLQAASPPQRLSPAVLALDALQPLLDADSNRSGGAQRSPASDTERKARSVGGNFYVREEEVEEEEARAWRAPIRRAPHNFLIPVYTSDDD